MTVAVQKQIPESLHHTCVVATWMGMTNGDVGQQIELANFADRSVQVSGAFGTGGSVAIEGSLDGEHWAVLTDPQGNGLNIAQAKIEAISEVARYVRPRVSAGDATTSLTITMLLKGASR